jgi:hypothetical protein
LLYPGKIHTFAGESESLKTWLLLVAAAQEINAGNHVLWLDFEDDERTAVDRLKALGVPGEDILDKFHYGRPEEPPDEWFAGWDLPALLTPMPTLVVIDGVTEVMTLLGYDPDRGNADVARFLGRLPRPVADAGPAVALLDNVSKSRETRGRYALGAVHKLNAVNGAAYTLQLKQEFGHDRMGKARIVIAKDRPGRVREHCPGKTAGDLVLDSKPDGSVFANLYPPEGADRPRDEPPTLFRPTVLMERIWDYAEANPGLSGNALETGVKGGNPAKRLARELLVNEGHLEARPREAYYVTIPYRAVNDTHAMGEVQPETNHDDN